MNNDFIKDSEKNEGQSRGHIKHNNTVWHHATITRPLRGKINGHKSATLWFTGLAGAGKSTLAQAVEEKLYYMGCRTYVFDGDNVRRGLCSDLGFSPKDRSENIRRIAEMVKLFIDAGIIAMTAFISPYRKDRDWARGLIGNPDFIEIYCNCNIEICEQRDKKGHYKKARAGEIPEFTGISAPYEAPENPELHLNTGEIPLEECVDIVIQYLLNRGVIEHKHYIQNQISRI